MTRIEELVNELVQYLPAATANQGILRPGYTAPAGPGTLKGFKAKVAEVFRLGESVGWDKALEARDYPSRLPDELISEDLSRVTRFEIHDDSTHHGISASGHRVWYGASVRLLLEDDGRTLKAELENSPAATDAEVREAISAGLSNFFDEHTAIAIRRYWERRWAAEAEEKAVAEGNPRPGDMHTFNDDGSIASHGDGSSCGRGWCRPA